MKVLKNYGKVAGKQFKKKKKKKKLAHIVKYYLSDRTFLNNFFFFFQYQSTMRWLEIFFFSFCRKEKLGPMN